ncbi:MAG: lytic murein transglycosylase [Acidimicrobiales bacterium]
MKGLVGAGLAVAAGLPMALAGVAAGVLGAAGPGVPSAQALGDIPTPLLGAYVASAATCPGLRWTVLAAIAKVESDHGRHGGAVLDPTGDVVPPIIGVALDGTGGSATVADTDGGRLDGDATWDRAVGPLQLLPASWARWGRDASGDGRADPDNAFDAIAAAAAYLCGTGGRVDDAAAAVRSYNHSDAYVAQVLAVAASYGDAGAVGGVSPIGVIDHPGLTLSAPARADLESGLVDPRLVSVLAIAASRFPIAVGVIRTGHSQCVGGGSRAERPTCSVSNHWGYRGVDIVAVAGRPVSAANDDARALAEFLLALPGSLRPDELGLPWAALDPLPVAFSDAAHQTHIHLGWSAEGASPTPSNP